MIEAKGGVKERKGGDKKWGEGVLLCNVPPSQPQASEASPPPAQAEVEEELGGGGQT